MEMQPDQKPNAKKQQLQHQGLEASGDATPEGNSM